MGVVTMPTDWQALIGQSWTSPWVEASADMVDWLHAAAPREPDPTPPTFQSAAEADAWLEAHPAVRGE